MKKLILIPIIALCLISSVYAADPVYIADDWTMVSASTVTLKKCVDSDGPNTRGQPFPLTFNILAGDNITVQWYEPGGGSGIDANDFFNMSIVVVDDTNGWPVSPTVYGSGSFQVLGYIPSGVGAFNLSVVIDTDLIAPLNISAHLIGQFGLEGASDDIAIQRDDSPDYPYYPHLGAYICQGCDIFTDCADYAKTLRFMAWHIPTAVPDSTPPVLSNYNCTSCNPPEGDATSPYTTEDTTPTFTFDTDENAWCAIGDENQNYTTMGSSRNCTGGEGTTSHTCTLTVQDQLLINETDYIYIGCKDSNDNENQTSSSGALEMQITTGQVEILGVQAIMAGINTSSIWPATVNSNQQVYLRDVNNNQILATFDRLATSGNQRWAFNYLDYAESFISNLFNITPAFYAAEYKEMTYQAVNDSVRQLIDDTNN